MLSQEEVQIYVRHFRETYGHRMTNRDLLRFSCIYESFKNLARRHPKGLQINWEAEVMYMMDTFGLDPREIAGMPKGFLKYPRRNRKGDIVDKLILLPQAGLALKGGELEAFRTYFGRNADRFRREVDEVRNMI